MRTTNTVPYTNARRAGRTSPGLIEMRDQIGMGGPRYLMNRRDRRIRGERWPIAAGTRRNPVSRWQRRRRQP